MKVRKGHALDLKLEFGHQFARKDFSFINTHKKRPEKVLNAARLENNPLFNRGELMQLSPLCSVW